MRYRGKRANQKPYRPYVRDTIPIQAVHLDPVFSSIIADSKMVDSTLFVTRKTLEYTFVTNVYRGFRRNRLPHEELPANRAFLNRIKRTA
jgi:hypothetical protein